MGKIKGFIAIKGDCINLVGVVVAIGVIKKINIDLKDGNGDDYGSSFLAAIGMVGSTVGGGTNIVVDMVGQGMVASFPVGGSIKMDCLKKNMKIIRVVSSIVKGIKIVGISCRVVSPVIRVGSNMVVGHVLLGLANNIVGKFMGVGTVVIKVYKIGICILQGFIVPHLGRVYKLKKKLAINNINIGVGG